MQPGKDSAVSSRTPVPTQFIIAFVAVWLFILVLIAMYATVAIALFPVSPFIALAAACLIRMPDVHDL